MCILSPHIIWAHKAESLYGSPSKNIARLQRVENTAAIVVTEKPSPSSLVDILHELRWLPVQWRINFKLASLTFNAIHTGIPPYLSHLLTPYCPPRVLRSSYSSDLLQVPRTNLTFGSRCFRAAASTSWNSLPDSLRSSKTFHSFRRHLKTHLYQADFNTPSGILQRLRFIYLTNGA